MLPLRARPLPSLTRAPLRYRSPLLGRPCAARPLTCSSARALPAWHTTPPRSLWTRATASSCDVPDSSLRCSRLSPTRSERPRWTSTLMTSAMRCSSFRRRGTLPRSSARCFPSSSTTSSSLSPVRVALCSLRQRRRA
uniref:Uncharacterized protein n=1 Tax=uncultured marine virus TaxID=186617 RepID=A0A0F7L894_9VIRU|nr:hypothetical protein [uncultured marine virus]